MKRAMGLILAVLSFGVVAHADRMEYSGTDYAGGAGTELRSDATFTEALDGSYDLIEPGSIALRAGRSLAESGDGERLTDYVLYSHFGDSAEVDVVPIQFDSTRPRLNSNWGDRYDGLGEYLRIEHLDPFRRALGVQEIPEPETLLLIGVGIAALTIWKRRMITSE
jgi:hypothetical protein